MMASIWTVMESFVRICKENKNVVIFFTLKTSEKKDTFLFFLQILTKDFVTIYVDAIMYYKVYNPIGAISNVDDFGQSSRLLAATTLRYYSRNLQIVQIPPYHTGTFSVQKTWEISSPRENPLPTWCSPPWTKPPTLGASRSNEWKCKFATFRTFSDSSFTTHKGQVEWSRVVNQFGSVFLTENFNPGCTLEI